MENILCYDKNCINFATLYHSGLKIYLCDDCGKKLNYRHMEILKNE